MVWRWPGEQAPTSQTWSSSNFIRHVFSTLRQNHFSFRKRCAARLPGLNAIGEVACAGLDGANRLASISVLEGLLVVHGAAPTVCTRARPSSKQKISLAEWKSGNVQDVDELGVIYHNWDEIR